MRQEIAKQNLSEEHKYCGKDDIKLSGEPDDHKNKGKKVAALNLLEDNVYACNMCEKEFNREKGLKTHVILNIPVLAHKLLHSQELLLSYRLFGYWV